MKDLLKPNVFGVGFYGVGEHTSKTAYLKWQRMLERCYSVSHKKQANGGISYLGCTVDPYWHNFQNFAEWYLSQNAPKVWHLDKDLLRRGNKIYSADTCCLLPPIINSALAYETKNTNKFVGVRQRGSGSYQVRCSVNAQRKHVGEFKCLEEAKDAYCVFKQDYLKGLAEIYVDFLSKEAYTALVEYKVRAKEV